MAVKVYNSILMKQVMRGNVVSNAIKPIAQKAAQQKFKAAQKKAVRYFDSHPVTREIEIGGDSPNISGTLHFPEAAKKGNLYSFIGFKGAKSTNMRGLRLLFTTYARVKWKSPRTIKMTNAIIYRFNTKIPNMAAFHQITPMPWPEGGQSWVQKVETGFSNLHYYKYKKGIDGSRSGYAIQLEKWGVYLPGSYYKPVGYINPIVTWWHKEIQRPVHMDATSIAAGTAIKELTGGAMPVRPGEGGWRKPLG